MGVNEDAKNLLSCQIPKLRNSKCNITAAKPTPIGGSYSVKPDLKFCLGSRHMTTPVPFDFGCLL